MCGIAGYVDSSGKQAQERVVDQMLSKLIHRGPDHQDTWSHRNVCLGYTRLSIMDPSDNGSQPFKTADGKGILSYNGEVYNYMELRHALEKKGVTFKSSCDTEVVLYALHVWGPEKAISKFNGMFSFAYYNLRTQTMWLGRDRAGIKPLYIARKNGILVFSSEMKALFEHPAIACRPDMHSLTTFLMERRLFRLTPFEDVSELTPGTLLRISDEGEYTFTYFDLLRDLDIDRLAEGQHTSAEEWEEKLEVLFPKCVQSHLMSDVPLAIMCSGGVDSSFLAAQAKEYKSDLIAYVADVEGLQTSETERARRACDHLDIELRKVPVDRKKYLKLWPAAAYQNDEPIFFKQNILHMAVAKAARNDGFKILLCGEGADELFGGYRWQSKVYEMWKVRRKRSKWIPNNRFTQFLFKYIPKNHPLNIDQLTGDPFRYLSEDPPPGQLEVRRLISVDGGHRALQRKKMMEMLHPLEKIEDRAFLARSFEDFLVHLSITLKCNDKMNMAASIESRVPYLDKRLIDFALHLPVQTKYRHNISKPLLRSTASNHLPHDLMHLPKIGFGYHDQLYNETVDFLDGGWLEEKLKWRTKHLDELKEYIRNRPHIHFHLVSTEIWAQIFFGNENPEKISDKLLSEYS